MSQVSWLTLDKIKEKNMSLLLWSIKSTMKLTTFIHAKNKAIVSKKCIKEEIVHNRCHNCYGWCLKKLRKTTWIKNETIKASFSDVLSLRTDTCANMEGRGEGEGKGSKEGSSFCFYLYTEKATVIVIQSWGHVGGQLDARVQSYVQWDPLY